MCLILFGLRSHPQYPLIVAANRDEFYARPSQGAHFWSDHPDVLAGRDVQAGGTWLGVNRSGLFSAVTNYRQGDTPQDRTGSRGELTLEFLSNSNPKTSYAEQLKKNQHRYNGFNLLTGGPDRLDYYSNKGQQQLNLASGIYGLSNALLNDPWPKVGRGKQQLKKIINSTSDPRELSLQLLKLLADDTQAPDSQLPETGISYSWEKKLSSRFIESETYGTRASTVVLFHNDGSIDFFERSHTPGEPPKDIHEQLKPTKTSS